jgi:transposase
MPTLLRANAPRDSSEERQVRRLAQRRRASGDWIERAKLIVRSWDGLRTTEIGRELGYHPQTVRERTLCFNGEGIMGLGDRTGPRRKPRLTEAEQSQIITLAKGTTPGAVIRQSEGTLATAEAESAAQWTLDALVDAAHQWGIQISRSQVRRVVLPEKVCWRSPHSWAHSPDPDFVPKDRDRLVLRHAPGERDSPRPGRARARDPAELPPAPGWSADVQRIKALFGTYFGACPAANADGGKHRRRPN